eukprot:CAMPEP_0176481646 /NCGR_PEP_ID=MMETSP0200_2-20121128/2938_1 /TAXON_ID=947934 /ORGANISM="Chaetoceros sp., Strain GSL56" /LENGTH=177 /DNA_ID=CAMNT_0017877879 /DNA_START=6 /DNA_END=539 /DNA_ORIENTATION=-
MSPQDKTSSPLDAFLKQQKQQSHQEDCDRPACKDTVDAMSSALNRLKNKAAAPNNSPSPMKECPPSKGVIGDSAWTFLHSMVAWYPDKPTAEQEKKMANFMEAVATFYPCSYCAEDFQENMKQSPIRTKTRQDLCVWLCEQHNKVNEKLGKKIFKCDIESLDERWRKSNDPACNPDV